MTAYQQSELLAAGRGLLIIFATLLLGILIYSARDYSDRQKLKARFPDDNNEYSNKPFSRILSDNLSAVVAYVGFSLGTGLAFGVFAIFMIFVGFPLILLALGILSFLLPYPS